MRRTLTSRTPARALLAGLLALAALGAGASAARASKPVVVAFSVSPRSLPSSGGTITITGRVRNAVSCTVYDDVAPVTVGCASGRFKVRRRLPRNTGNRTRDECAGQAGRHARSS